MSVTAPADDSTAGASIGSRLEAGLLVIDKPTGVTSHDVVARVRRRLEVRNAGHAGTLDPGASGLLLVAVGAATRCVSVWQGGVKTYEGTALFGVVTRTQDMTGEVIERRAVELDEATVRESARSLVGEIEQVPPMVSALKVRGQRLYRLARRGIEVERAPRRVTVSSWEWLRFELPEADFRVRCSSGTYVRTLIHDLGQRVRSGGTLKALRRLRSEPFELERSVTTHDIQVLTREEVWARAGIPLEEALSVIPSVRLDEAGAATVGFGGRVRVDAAALSAASSRPHPPGAGSGGETAFPTGRRSIALVGPDGRALGLGELKRDPAASGSFMACPQVVFPWAVREGFS